jgi:hypothetical protein
MSRTLRIAFTALSVVGALAGGPAAGDASAQVGAGLRARAAQRRQALGTGEVERLFDGYVAMQAQDALKLSDSQFPQFLARLRALQRTRRQHLLDRRQVVADLAAATSGTAADNRVVDLLKRLRELDAKYAEDLQRAYDGVDQVLDPGQQARFRVFEDSVERRKLELMLRARRTAQQKGLIDRQPQP